MLPYAGGVVLAILLLFALYVRSVPPAVPVPKVQQPKFQGSVPNFMNVDTEPMVKEALEEATEALKKRDQEDVAKAEAGEEKTETTDASFEL
jgi:hypothetical protein